MVDAILNLDMDFFTSPPYFGRFYGKPEAVSYSSFHATSSIWLDPKDFVAKLGLGHRIRGQKMREDNQSFLYIQSMLTAKVVEPKKFTIVNFDSHHDCFIHWDEHWFRSMEGALHNYDNMVAPFLHDWVDEIVWVTPGYMTDDMYREQFRDMNVTFQDDVAIIHISQSLKARVRRVRWSDYNKESFKWRYFNLIINPEMSKATPQMIESLSAFVSVF